MKISSEFSKYAVGYNKYNIIQSKALSKLISLVKSKPKNILDLGCGSGAVCKNIDWVYESFTALDFATGMLELHPKSSKIKCMYGSFNDKWLFEHFLTDDYDYVFSASALQWAQDLDSVFDSIKSLNAPIALALFTSGTFTTLNKTANLKPILRDANTIKDLSDKHFDADFELVSYKLEFESTREMFRYIKKSGVSGSRKVLSYTQTKKLMKEYPLNYLEFEVAFIVSR
jgi:malonyl-CoA O-methyltransferase